MRHIFGLVYLDPSEVSDCFVFDLMEEQPENNNALTKMADYLVDNYIPESSQFPPYLWASNCHSTENTTNACESFHSKFNDYFYSSHPSLYIFIDILKQFQTETYIKINSVTTQCKMCNKGVRTRHEVLKAKIDEYESGQISRIEFVKCVSYRGKK